MSELPSEFRPASDFAEVAEALDVNTDQVVASKLTDGVLTVMYSPDNDDLERIWGCLLRRDSGGILRVHSVPVEIPGFWDHLKRQMEG